MDLQLIKTISSKKNIKLEDLAKLAGLKRATFFNYLSGKTSIPADALKRLSDILEIPVARLYEDSSDLESSVSNDPALTYASGKNVKEIPLVYKFAYADFLSDSTSKEFIQNLPKYPILADQPMVGRYFCFEVSGESMSDGTINSRISGDVVLAKEIEKHQWKTELTSHNRNFIIIHDTEGIQIKRIVAHNLKTGSITVGSLNANYSKSELSLSEVSAIFREVKLVSRDSEL